MNVVKAKLTQTFLIILLTFFTGSVSAALSGTYYIDATNGNDAFTGKTEGAAWKTFAKVNSNVLSAGTKILLKKGEVWNQRLEIRGSGTAANWISVGSYGAANAKPKISLTNNKDDIGILICDLDRTSGIARQQNISYIEVSDLEIANTRLGIYYRCVMGTQNTGFRVKNITFNNINCDEVMSACNAGTDKDVKHAEISRQVAAVKGNLPTTSAATGGGAYEYIFPAAVFVGGKIPSNQRVSGSHITVLTEFEVSDCEFNEAIAGVMSVFYWPFSSGMGADAWRQIVNRVKVKNCIGTGVVNGMIAFDGVNGGAVPDANGVMQPDANGWGLLENVYAKMGSAVPGRTWPDGTTGVIFSNTQNFLVDKCEFSDIINQGNPDGCGFDFETNCNQVTLQNTKFINNDGHAILMMNGGAFGGSTHIKIQNNLFAKNIKSSPSLFELELSDPIDGHSDIVVRNNISFLRKTNKDTKNISFYNTNRTYVTATDNDIYYLDETAQPITVSFLGQAYTFNAASNSVSTPVISALELNNGLLFTEKQDLEIISRVTKGAPAYYKISEKSDLSDANWTLYNSKVPFAISTGERLKRIFFKVKNSAGESETASFNVIYKPATPKLDASNRSHVKISPNPVKSYTRFTLIDGVRNEEINVGDKTYQFSITSTEGKRYFQFSGNEKDFTLDLSILPKGIFVLKLTDGVETITNKFTKI